MIDMFTNRSNFVVLSAPYKLDKTENVLEFIAVCRFKVQLHLYFNQLGHNKPKEPSEKPIDCNSKFLAADEFSDQ